MHVLFGTNHSQGFNTRLASASHKSEKGFALAPMDSQATGYDDSSYFVDMDIWQLADEIILWESLWAFCLWISHWPALHFAVTCTCLLPLANSDSCPAAAAAAAGGDLWCNNINPELLP